MINIDLTSLSANAATPKYDGAYIAGNRPVGLPVIRTDDFSTGIDSTFYTNEAGSAYIEASSDSVGGNSSQKVKLSFLGSSDTTVDALAQLGFTLPKICTEIIIEFDLYIPSNYSHVVPSDNANNNKFFRLWQTTYSSTTTGQHCGASTFANGGNSSLSTECQHYGSGVGPGVGDGDISFTNFITSGDKGTWLAIRIHAKAPTVGANYQYTDQNGTFWRGDGFLRIYKNGTLTSRNNTLPAIGTGSQGWRYGNLLGAANSGFRQNTYMYIDNLVISGD